MLSSIPRIVTMFFLTGGLFLAVMALTGRAPSSVWAQALGLSTGFLLADLFQMAWRRGSTRTSRPARKRSPLKWALAFAGVGALIVAANGLLGGYAVPWSAVDWIGACLSGAGILGLGGYLLIGLGNLTRGRRAATITG